MNQASTHTPNDEPKQDQPDAQPEHAMQQRTVAAETRAGELEAQLQEARHSLEQSQQALDASERKRTIERQLAAEGALDLEAGALLAEAAIADVAEPDIPGTVAQLKRTKPFLFRPPPAPRASSMSGAVSPTPPLDQAALEARRSGDRRALLRYLRLRRGG